jgi:hypothetical protein
VRPVVPTVAVAGSSFCELGLGQPGVEVLPAFLEPGGVVATEWELTAEERAAIAAGANIRLFIQTGGDAVQPVSLEVGS